MLTERLHESFAAHIFTELQFILRENPKDLGHNEAHPEGMSSVEVSFQQFILSVIWFSFENVLNKVVF